VALADRRDVAEERLQRGRDRLDRLPPPLLSRARNTFANCRMR
jgi:hypothetical protein